MEDTTSLTGLLYDDHIDVVPGTSRSVWEVNSRPTDTHLLRPRAAKALNLFAPNFWRPIWAANAPAFVMPCSPLRVFDNLAKRAPEPSLGLAISAPCRSGTAHLSGG